MTEADLALLRAQLLDHEGLRLRPYTDTRGVLTIGIGRNLRDKGITLRTAQQMLDEDIDECLSDLRSFGWFFALDAVRLRAVIDLRFNLGGAKLRTFVRFLDAMARKDYEAAARELETSAWFGQVGRRGPRLVAMIRTGKDPV